MHHTASRVRAIVFVIAVTQTGCDGAALVDAGTDSGARMDAGSVCESDLACDDGVYCNGAERCDAGQCVAGTAPCATALCSEAARTCETDCDLDRDGHDAISCGGDDCDDDDPTRSPGNVEVCNTADEDCNPTTYGERDADGDGYVSDACCNVATDGTRRCGEDCDDARRGVNPDVPEVCDAIDNDCDGAIDEGVLLRCYVDGDGDGYALTDAASVETCECPTRTTSRPPSDAADCNDTLADVSPGSAEICGNGRDDDCDGTVDEAGNDWYRDCDGDGYGTGTPVRACVSPGTPGGCPGGGHVLLAGDCDDTNELVYPAAPEICDGVLNDCTSSTVDGPAATAWCNGREPNIVAACSGGACVFERCVTGFLDCSSAPGCETDGRTDRESCGACDNECTAPWAGVAVCTMGECGDPVEIAVGELHTCARRASGAVDCWGWNSGGQLGDGTATNRPTPTPTSGLTDAVELGAGYYHTCARRASGLVVCWGGNGFGQLGDGTTTTRRIPTAVSGLTGAVEIAVGELHTCARRASGAVDCWGWNYQGQLGDGTRTDRLTPTLVSGLTDAVELALGESHSCARRASGAVVCWGNNSWAQLGAPYLGDRLLTPSTPVAELTDAVELSAGAHHTCARRSSGVVVCWGDNSDGQLGDGTTTQRLTPTPVSGLTDAIELGAGRFHTCARRASGAVVCWGNNGYNQLGDGTSTGRLTPTAVQPPP